MSGIPGEEPLFSLEEAGGEEEAARWADEARVRVLLTRHAATGGLSIYETDELAALTARLLGIEIPAPEDEDEDEPPPRGEHTVIPSNPDLLLTSTWYPLGTERGENTMKPSNHGMDPSLAFTALLEQGGLQGLTMDEGEALKAGLLNAYYAQETIRNLYDFTREWLAQPEVNRDADVAWATTWGKVFGKTSNHDRDVFIAGFLAGTAKAITRFQAMISAAGES